MSIVITGATGALGGLVVDHLLNKNVPASEIVVSVRNVEKGAELASRGIEVRHGDYDDAASLEKSFAGASKLFLVSSPLMDDTVRVRQHATAIEAARNAGVGHIVYTSFAFAEKSTIGLQEVHLATEHMIRTTGIPYTILRNPLYTHIFVNEGLLPAVERGEMITSAGNGKLNVATRNDLALAAATVLAQDGHENKVYNLTAPTAWSFDELAQILSEVSGKKVVHRSTSEAEVVEDLKKAGVAEPLIGFQVYGLYRSVANGELEDTTNDLKNLIGDSITPLKQSVQELFNR
ncbi:SDR family oxidoreductase [Paenibacillus sediminis]|uniref:NAD(P)H dehydrogenase (Quinone) n=1 Tax=Paenibacillus sediminis TaxID=664909 RepID=A0ABS4H412_9BACL|nr:SDR family oxidoreductase [Paenibacillus sediminis]MBP1937191.1 NAD(P)H dehydrogenase (quinone) [Paenibacillus sediminis]